MSEEDKEWLRGVCRRSILAQKLGVRGVFTGEEHFRWERLYDQHKEEYMRMVEELQNEQET